MPQVQPNKDRLIDWSSITQCWSFTKTNATNTHRHLILGLQYLSYRYQYHHRATYWLVPWCLQERKALHSVISRPINVHIILRKSLRSNKSTQQTPKLLHWLQLTPLTTSATNEFIAFIAATTICFTRSRAYLYTLHVALAREWPSLEICCC